MTTISCSAPATGLLLVSAPKAKRYNLLVARRHSRAGPSPRHRTCLLIIIGATRQGRKELVGLTDGVRESAQSWRELLLDLKRRGLSIHLHAQPHRQSAQEPFG